MTDPTDGMSLDQRRKYFATIPHMKALGGEVLQYDDTGVVHRLAWREELVGDPDRGILAGGVITALLDNAAGSAVVQKINKPDGLATLDLRIDYLKPSRPHADVYTWTECYHITRRIAFVRGLAYNDSRDDPIAHCTATFMLMGEPGDKEVDA